MDAILPLEIAESPGVATPSSTPVTVGLVAPRGPGNGVVWETLEHAEAMLRRFGVTSVRLGEAAAAGRGSDVRVLIVGSADGELPASLAAAADGPPVIRVPVATNPDTGDALQLLWPETIPPAAGGTTPFATVAVGEAGAKNAALLAVAILAVGDGRLRAALHGFRREQTAAVLAATLPPLD